LDVGDISSDILDVVFVQGVVVDLVISLVSSDTLGVFEVHKGEIVKVQKGERHYTW
jgi:hypothetical protein